MKLKVGVMLPRSDMYPTLAKDFLNGLKLAYQLGEQQNTYPNILIEGIGNATGANLLAIAEKLILQEDVDLVISFCSYYNLSEFVRVFESYKKPLIHIDLGGNVLKADHVNPYVIHHTLNLWHSCYLAGVYAANSNGKRAALTTSYYDGGYNLAESFVKGFTDSGGEIVFNYVSPMDYKSETFDDMLEGLQSTMPEVVFSLFSFKEGNKVRDLLAHSELNGKTTFIAAPLLTEDTLRHTQKSLDNLLSIASWAFEDEIEQMQSFNKGYQNAYEVSPNLISLMAYEVGLLLTHFMSETGNIPNRIGDAVAFLLLDTPRGEITYNDYNESQVTHNYVRKFISSKEGCKNELLATIDAKCENELYEYFKDHPFSGWHNPYIIT